eukprot:1143539-Pelagomonas_calceolata.AAC.3
MGATFGCCCCCWWWWWYSGTCWHSGTVVVQRYGGGAAPVMDDACVDVSVMMFQWRLVEQRQCMELCLPMQVDHRCVGHASPCVCRVLALVRVDFACVSFVFEEACTTPGSRLP